MAMVQYSIHVGENGSVVIPATPFTVGEEVEVVLRTSKDDSRQFEPVKIQPNGKTPVDDFLDFCKELNLPPLTDEEVEKIRFDALMEKYG